MANGHGGSRLGAGKKKGTKWPSTIRKAQAQERLMDLVIAELDDLTQRQITNAKGLSHFFMRDPTTKQFKQVTDPAMIEVALNAGEEGSYFWIHTKDPSTQAFTALMDRALDRPTERQQQEVSGKVELEITKPW